MSYKNNLKETLNISYSNLENKISTKTFNDIKLRNNQNLNKENFNFIEIMFFNLSLDQLNEIQLNRCIKKTISYEQKYPDDILFLVLILNEQNLFYALKVLKCIKIQNIVQFYTFFNYPNQYLYIFTQEEIILNNIQIIQNSKE